MKKIDLSTCKPRQKLRTRAGQTRTYVRPENGGHVVMCDDGNEYFRQYDGAACFTGDDIVEVLPLDEPAKLTGSPAYYYAYRIGGDAPSVRHKTRADAMAEAERLAAKHPGAQFEILRCVGIASTPVPTASTFWMDGETAEGGVL